MSAVLSSLTYELYVFHTVVYELVQKENPLATHVELGAIMARLTLSTEVRLTHGLLEVPDAVIEVYDRVHGDEKEFHQIHDGLCAERANCEVGKDEKDA